MDTPGSLRLLIVEDDVVDRKRLERLLAQSSLGAYQVQKADRLAGALELLRQWPCDLVLLDLGLPDSQGMESVVRLQACAPQTPIIVLSGLDDVDVATQAVQMGVQDYLIKGQVDASLLLRAIRYALERKRAQRQLQAAELRYRTIFENSAVAIMMVDEQRRLISWNQFTEQLLRLPGDRLRGRLIQEFYPPSEWHRIQALSIRRKGMGHHLETKMIRGDGAVIDVDISLSVVHDSDGRTTGTIGVVQDITERKRAAEALLVLHETLDRKQRNLEAIFDAAPLGMLLVNPQMRVVRANDTIHQMSGKEYARLIDHGPCEALGCLRATAASERGLRRADDGLEEPSSAHPQSEIRNPQCDDCRLWQTIQTALASGVPVEGVEVRPKLNPGPSNADICPRSGRGQAPPAQAGVGDPGDGDQVQRDPDPRPRTSAAGSPTKRDISHLGRAPTGETEPVGTRTQRWLSVSVEPVNVDGVKHVVVALNDITDRKRAEEELKETMEMKSQFISTVSHELRTPMTAMREAVIIVLDEIAGKLNEDQKHFLDIAKRNIDRLSRLIDDVLDFQKLSAGKMKFHLQANDIAAVVQEAYATMQPHAAKSGVLLAVEMEPHLPAALYDGDRIMQALTNLISNAIKFTPPGGRVLVSARRRKGSGPPPHTSAAGRGSPTPPFALGAPSPLPNAKGGVGDPEEQLVLQVSDTGYGIPQEDLPKLFSQFFRVHRPGKEIKGTGLGLAIVSKIVAGHGGRIEVESELNQGTTFTVFLPLTPPRTARETSDDIDRHLENMLTEP